MLPMLRATGARCRTCNDEATNHVGESRRDVAWHSRAILEGWGSLFFFHRLTERGGKGAVGVDMTCHCHATPDSSKSGGSDCRSQLAS